MRKKRAYDLFSRVATYDGFLQGISSITISGTEAVAEIMILREQPSRYESTVVQTCDAVSFDNFIQVAGLLINTGDAVSESEIMACSEIGNALLSRGANFMDCRAWKINASYTMASPSQAIGDVIVFGLDTSAAAPLTGCRFANIDVARLERLLSSTPRISVPEHAEPPSFGQGVLSPLSPREAGWC